KPSEPLALFRFLPQQWRDVEAVLVEAGDDLGQALAAGPEHGAAAIDRPAIAVDPDDIDIGCALGHAFLEYLRAFIDHRVERPLDDLLVGDPVLWRVGLPAEVLDDLGDARV